MEEIIEEKLKNSNGGNKGRKERGEEIKRTRRSCGMFSRIQGSDDLVQQLIKLLNVP